MNIIKYAAGMILARINKKKCAEIYNNFTIPSAYFYDKNLDSLMDRLIRYYFVCKVKRLEHSTPGELEALHKNFWSKIDRYFTNTKNRADEVHIPAYRDIVCM
jgi:hypothetical protein